MDATHTPEEWRPVVGHEGRYEVSNHGRVRSVDRIIETRRGPRPAQGKLRTLSLKKTGYLECALWDRGAARHALVHSLVLEAFVGARQEGMEACHNDGNRQNNRVDNLRWDTHSANVLDSVRSRTMHQSAKERCPKGHLYDHVEVSAKTTCRRCSKCRNEQRLRRLAIPREWGATHCKNGHEWTPENTYIRAGGGARSCRACNRERARNNYRVK